MIEQVAEGVLRTPLAPLPARIPQFLDRHRHQRSGLMIREASNRERLLERIPAPNPLRLPAVRNDARGAT